MEKVKASSNDIKEFWNSIKDDFSYDRNNTFFIAQYTDKFVVGNWNNDCNVNEEKLLELRIFDKDKEWKLFRSDLGRGFLWRCRYEKWIKGVSGAVDSGDGLETSRVPRRRGCPQLWIVLWIKLSTVLHTCVHRCGRVTSVCFPSFHRGR